MLNAGPTRLIAATLAVALVSLASPAMAQQLSGTVSSAAEGPMEGVVVSAKRDRSTTTVSVITNANGAFSFPASHVSPGKYTLSVRATGYDLQGSHTAEFSGNATVKLGLQLIKTRRLSEQLTNAEWMLSVPGSEAEKLNLINCVSCHTHERIMASKHTADEWVQVLARMAGYAQVSQPIKPQLRVDQSRASNPEQRFRKMAEWLANANLSKGDTWSYELKTLPRITGRGTRAIITEYDLPRPTIEPHDVIVHDGAVWYTNFGEQFLGRLDPATGKHTEYAMPELKKGFPSGNLDLGVDRDGQMWIGMMYQAVIARFDPKTATFKYYPVSAARMRDDTQINMVTTNHHVDGKVWANDAGTAKIFRLDVNTGVYEDLDPVKALPNGGRGLTFYDTRADSQNNLYATEFISNYLVRVDAKTLATTVYQAPTDVSRNRRSRMDDQDRLWFAQYRGNKIAMFDTRTETFKEWPMPTRYSTPYDVIWDNNGDLWTGGMTTDRVIRLNPKTGEVVEYPLPRDTNIRRVFVDNSTPRPTFWVGNNHMASIIKLEPLD